MGNNERKLNLQQNSFVIEIGVYALKGFADNVQFFINRSRTELPNDLKEELKLIASDPRHALQTDNDWEEYLEIWNNEVSPRLSQQLPQRIWYQEDGSTVQNVADRRMGRNPSMRPCPLGGLIGEIVERINNQENGNSPPRSLAKLVAIAREEQLSLQHSKSK